MPPLGLGRWGQVLALEEAAERSAEECAELRAELRYNFLLFRSLSMRAVVPGTAAWSHAQDSAHCRYLQSPGVERSARPRCSL